MACRWAGVVALMVGVGCGHEDAQGGAETDAADVTAGDGGGDVLDVAPSDELGDASDADPSDLVEPPDGKGDASGDVAESADAPDVAADSSVDVAMDTATDAANDTEPIDCGDCDDGLTCTNDVCGLDGICQHHARAGWCKVAGGCIEAGDGPLPCVICAPDVNPNGLTSLSGGPCDDGNPCTVGDQCTLGTCGGATPACDATSTCHESLGCDEETGACVEEAIADGTPCGAGEVCAAGECTVGDGLPMGTIAWFEALRCPEGWEQYAPATGRTLVPVGPLGPQGGLAEDGTPLGAGPAPAHGHAISGAITLGAQRFVGVGGGGNGLAEAGVYTVTGALAEASLGLPYLQLLACTKTSDVVLGAAPAGVFTFASEQCAEGLSASTEGVDRLVVGVPEGGSAGATFGAPAGLATRPSHAHDVSGIFPISSHGIALASGCCSPDYASSDDPAVRLVSGPPSSAEGLVFPWRAAFQCVAPAPAGDAPPDTAPPGIVLFASDATCPEGWSELTAARGRIIVGAETGGDVGVIVGTPLAEREDRAHSHTASLAITLIQRNIAAAKGPNNSGAAPGLHQASLGSAPATSGLPFRQLLACKKP